MFEYLLRHCLTSSTLLKFVPSIKTINRTPLNLSIIASINGHTLTVVFTENLGNVTIEVKDVYGESVDLDLIGTPNGYECYIPLAGHYTVYFKLTNGDTYYGDFDVTD